MSLCHTMEALQKWQTSIALARSGSQSCIHQCSREVPALWHGQKWWKAGLKNAMPGRYAGWQGGGLVFKELVDWKSRCQSCAWKKRSWIHEGRCMSHGKDLL